MTKRGGGGGGGGGGLGEAVVTGGGGGGCSISITAPSAQLGQITTLFEEPLRFETRGALRLREGVNEPKAATPVDSAAEQMRAMAVMKKHTFLLIMGLIMRNTYSVSSDTFQEDDFPHQLFDSFTEDDSQITSCDFESLCLWTLSHNLTHIDWSVVSPQLLQGAKMEKIPPTDHSVGTSDGHFLLLSTTSAAGPTGRCEYHLTSPVLPGSNRQCILQVALYDTRPTQGNLTILIKPIMSDLPNRSETFSHRRRDDRRPEWQVLEAGIGQVNEPFQVTLIYTSCVPEDRVVALDSLDFIHCELDDDDEDLHAVCEESFHCENSGSCINQSKVCNFHTDCPMGEDEGLICDGLPFGSYCSFDWDLCGWSAISQHSGWRRVAGNELLDKENMQGITLQRTPGYFLFLQVEQSNSVQKASIQSSSFPRPISTTGCQMRFSLYIYGLFNGLLKVAIEENGTNAALLVWERHGQWTDDWEVVALELTGLQHGFHIKVTAEWRQGSSADVALDNIAVGAACFSKDLNSLLQMADLDFLTPLPEPSVSEVSLMTWWFNSCGASGPHGPTQAQCDSTYRNKNVSVSVGKEGSLKGVQMWKVPDTNRYLISAYGAAGGKGAKNHNKRNHGVFISASFPLEKGDTLYILVGHQGEDACPGKENGELVPLLIAAGGGGNAYMESSLDQISLEQYENSTTAPGTNGQTGKAGGGGGWKDNPSPHLTAGKSLMEGAVGGSSCPLALSKLGWSTFGGFGGGGGACTAGGGGGGYRGGDSALTDDITADGQNGVSFIHPLGEIFLQPLAAMEGHGECEIKVQLNCSHCKTQSCKREEESHFILCVCDDEEFLASDNVTCISAAAAPPPGEMSTSLVLAVVVSTIASGVALVCTGIILMWYRRKIDMLAVRRRLQSPEYKLSKIRSSTIMTDYNPNYCFVGKVASLSDLKEVPRQNITLFRALGHGAFGEVYEGQVLRMNPDGSPMQVAVKTLPEICSEQDEMDFLMEALIMSKFSHENIVRCIGVSLNILPRFILLELMIGGDMKTFLRQNRPRTGQTPSLTMLELLQMARDIANGCRYLEENQFIHRDIAARNCLLTCAGPERVAKIGDFGMARDIYRASYYRKGGRAMLPVKWMPPEAFVEGIFTCKTDIWSFGVLLWEILSLGYMPYPCKTNQEVLEFVTSGGRMDPPKGCPGPVYRLMTQCWQHCPNQRPNFSTILERINFCTQDPDVVNAPLPVECGPNMEEDGGPVMRPSVPPSTSITPLLVSHSVCQDSPSQMAFSPRSFGPPTPPPQPTKPRLLLQKTQPIHHEVTSCCEVLQPSWAETVPAPGLSAGGHRLHHAEHRSCSRSSSSSGSQKLKNKTKNLWNPTYGSWVLENSKGRKTLAHTQSMPLSSSTPNSQSCSPASENKSVCDSTSSSYLSSSPPPASPTQAPLTASSGATKAGVDLAKLQSFPCGNVNYAYEEQSHEVESLPLVAAKAVEVTTNSSPTPGSGPQASSTCKPKLFLKRHASYGHEDMKRHAKAEKPTRDRDSGFSLSEDLSIYHS
ncbi:ALK tyrosine kinase receptor [Oryzias melastigma]|uniref:Tyrosine-protein kinase receptor n=1 Tax=Oryzias melastigma TaxID=30732 RepID=A0A834BXW4_ORYME|nr:ALK tyrosine kinase receptor [Oryzias melastigma]